MKRSTIPAAALTLFLLTSVSVIGCNDSVSTRSKATSVNDGQQAAPPTPEVSKSYWHIESDINSVTGVVTKTAYLLYQGDQNIYVRQTGKTLECYITTDKFLETTDNLDSRNSTVQYKFDNGKVIRQTWSISNNNEDLFYRGNPKPFLAQMRKAKSLSIEYHPADEVPQTITFDVTGFPDVFTK